MSKTPNAYRLIEQRLSEVSVSDWTPVDHRDLPKQVQRYNHPKATAMMFQFPGLHQPQVFLVSPQAPPVTAQAVGYTSAVQTYNIAVRYHSDEGPVTAEGIVGVVPGEYPIKIDMGIRDKFQWEKLLRTAPAIAKKWLAKYAY